MVLLQYANRRLELAGDRRGAVSGTIVNDQNFLGSNRLVQGAADRLAQKVGSVVRRDNQANIVATHFSGPFVVLRFGEEIPGWFFPRSSAIWDCLLSLQRDEAIAGNLLEIGVWRGKSALLTAMHARRDELCLFVDPVLHATTESLLQESTDAECQFVREMSVALHRSPLLVSHARTFRWIHIDGEHSGTMVYEDLKIGCQLLSETGILVVDDFFNPIWPQITKAAFDFSARHDRELALFLCGDNKGYFCRPRHMSIYMTYIRQQMFDDMQARGEGDISICKTTVPDDMNCFGIVNRFKDRDYVGPDWDIDSA